MKFCNRLRPALHTRFEAFNSGFRALGYKESSADKCDVLLIWNRRAMDHTLAKACEARGGTVLVAENAAWGNDFMGGHWCSLARGFHNERWRFKQGGDERWDSLNVPLAQWRPEGGEVIGLPQRGIGLHGHAMPLGWVPKGCTRIRKHPGARPCKPLEDDLAQASKVVTWGSGAAIKALMWGISVESHMPNWIGEQDNTDDGRLAMLRRLAWAQWRIAEIESGEAIRWAIS